MIAITVLAWGAVPVAFLLELNASRSALASRSELAEAWLAAGARPLEVIGLLRSRRVFWLVFAACALAATLAALLGSREWVPPALASALVGIVVARSLGSAVAVLRGFVDDRLVDRVPDEARHAFRPEAQAPPPPPLVYESRPPLDAMDMPALDDDSGDP